MFNNICVFSIDHHALSVDTAQIDDALNQSSRAQLSLRVDASVDAASWLGKKASCHLHVAHQSRYFHGMVTAVTMEGSQCHVRMESPLCLLQYQIRSRRFSHTTLHALYKKLLAEFTLEMTIADKALTYVEQHQCSDAEFFQRMIETNEHIYYVRSDEHSATVHINDVNCVSNEVIAFPFMPERSAENDVLKITDIQSNKEVFHCTSNILSLHPNAVFSLRGHPDNRLQQIYRVIRSEHRWQADSIVYEHQFTVKPIHAAQTTKEITQYDMSYLTLRKLDHQDNHYREPIATTYQGQDMGLQFPLLDQTTVVIGREDSQPDLPVILGALYDGVYRHPLVASHAEQQVIQTQYGHALRMDDHFHERTIRLSTNGLAQSIEIKSNEHTRHIDLNSAQGDVVLNAEKNISFQNRENIQWRADKTIEVSGQSVEMVARDKSMQMASGGHVTIDSKKDMQIHVKKSLITHVEQQASIQAGQGYQLSCAKEAVINTTETLSLVSAKQLYCRADTLICETGQSKMHYLEGQLGLSASSITLMADDIFINQSSIINK